MVASIIGLASQSNEFDQVTEHLKFLGYEITKDGDRLKAKHPKYFNLAIRKYKGGMLFTTYLGASSNAKRNRPAFLELVNSLNNDATVSRAYLDKDGDLTMEAWYPGSYQKTAFSLFMDEWSKDTAEQLQKKADEAIKFLK